MKASQTGTSATPPIAIQVGVIFVILGAMRAANRLAGALLLAAVLAGCDTTAAVQSDPIAALHLPHSGGPLMSEAVLSSRSPTVVQHLKECNDLWTYAGNENAPLVRRVNRAKLLAMDGIASYLAFLLEFRKPCRPQIAEYVADCEAFFSN